MVAIGVGDNYNNITSAANTALCGHSQDDTRLSTLIQSRSNSVSTVDWRKYRPLISSPLLSTESSHGFNASSKVAYVT